MNIIQTLVLAVVQGITEFIPVSSSAHLVLISYWLGWADQGLLFDVALHCGTLIALLLYFRQAVLQCIQEFFSWFTNPRNIPNTLAFKLAVCSIPVMLAGAFGHHAIEQYCRSPQLLAYTTLGFGALLGVALLHRPGTLGYTDLSVKQVLLIGCFQALSLIPGTSRSGITLTACLLLGLPPQAAATFSLLCGIPTLIMASTYELVHAQGVPIEHLNMIFLGMVTSAVVALACIRLFLQWVGRYGLWPFVAYRMVLGLCLFIF
ncbi:MAG: undecaprenyl-diphosphate phosphatase [Pseudomonadota bacterium]